MSGEMVTRLTLALFRVNNAVLLHGDRLVQQYGLTSARWQVLGAAVLADGALPVAGLARTLGTSRQGVQRIVNDLVRDGLATFAPNPQHRRAQLVVPTPAGRAAHDAAIAAWAPVADSLSDGVSADDLAAALRVLETLGERLAAPG